MIGDTPFRMAAFGQASRCGVVEPAGPLSRVDLGRVRFGFSGVIPAFLRRAALDFQWLRQSRLAKYCALRMTA